MPGHVGREAGPCHPKRERSPFESLALFLRTRMTLRMPVITLLQISSGVRGQTAPGLGGCGGILQSARSTEIKLLKTKRRDVRISPRSTSKIPITLHGHRHPCLYRDRSMPHDSCRAKTAKAHFSREPPDRDIRRSRLRPYPTDATLSVLSQRCCSITRVAHHHKTRP